MKKLLFALCLAAVSLCAAEKKVMTIGNSFTWSLRGDFPALVKSQKDKLTLGFANHGGCTIQRHWEYVEKEENNAAVKLYKYKGKKNEAARNACCRKVGCCYHSAAKFEKQYFRKFLS